MNEYMTLSVASASVLYFVLLMLIFGAVYAVGLIVEWRRRK